MVIPVNAAVNSIYSSNRTFMELKWLSGEHVTMGKVSSNRTFMELKFVS